MYAWTTGRQHGFLYYRTSEGKESVFGFTKAFTLFTLLTLLYFVNLFNISSFVTEETWKNITYFQRRSVQDSQRSCSVLQCHTLQNDKFSISELRFFSQEHIKTLMFAKEILLVEGDTDKMFVQKLLAYLKCKRTLENLLSNLSDSEKDEISENKVRYGNIKVVNMNGKETMPKVTKLCELLDISCRILYDRDQVNKKKDMMTGLDHCLSTEALNLEIILGRIGNKTVQREKYKFILFQTMSSFCSNQIMSQYGYFSVKMRLEKN